MPHKLSQLFIDKAVPIKAVAKLNYIKYIVAPPPPTHTHTHARTHAHAHMHAHTRTHTYTYAHAHNRRDDRIVLFNTVIGFCYIF